MFLSANLNSKLHHHAHRREHGAAHAWDLAEEVAVIVRRIGHRLALRREVRVDGRHGIGRAVDVLYVEVEVERPLAEVKLFVHAQIELVRRRQTQRVEARIVQIGRVAEPPNGFLCRELRVDRRVGCTAQSAPARGKAPVVRQFPARYQVDDVAGVPRGGLILPLQIGEFAAEERDRGRSRQALR